MNNIHQLTNEVYREDKFIWTILDKEEENKVKENDFSLGSIWKMLGNLLKNK